jgi:hypothetical protein
MELTAAVKELLTDTVKKLKGSARRIFQAQSVKALGKGGQRRAQSELGWDRNTIRKGTHELDSGITCIDNLSVRHGKLAEEHLPNLLNDIKAIVDGQSQTDPLFQTQRLYRRISAAEVRRQLIAQKGYTDEQLPCALTISNKLDFLGYYPARVQKSKPKKKFHRPMPSLNS